MSNKIFSRDGLFRPRYTFLVAGGGHQGHFSLLMLHLCLNFHRTPEVKVSNTRNKGQLQKVQIKHLCYLWFILFCSLHWQASVAWKEIADKSFFETCKPCKRTENRNDVVSQWPVSNPCSMEQGQLSNINGNIVVSSEADRLSVQHGRYYPLTPYQWK